MARPYGPSTLPTDVVVVGAVSERAATDRSGSITTGGSAQQLAAANPSRVKLAGQNISGGDLWINENGGTAAPDTAGSYVVPSRAMFSISTTSAVSIVGATTGQKFTAQES